MKNDNHFINALIGLVNCTQSLSSSSKVTSNLNPINIKHFPKVPLLWANIRGLLDFKCVINLSYSSHRSHRKQGYDSAYKLFFRQTLRKRLGSVHASFNANDYNKDSYSNSEKSRVPLGYDKSIHSSKNSFHQEKGSINLWYWRGLWSTYLFH